MASVTGLMKEVKNFIKIQGTKKRVKLAISDGSTTNISKKSYEVLAEVERIFRPYVEKDELEVKDFRVRKGVKYKIGGKKYLSNYVEVVVLVNKFPTDYDLYEDFGNFMGEGSRPCGTVNSRDKAIRADVERMSTAE